MIFIGIDPGETTGVAKWDSDEPASEIKTLQIPPVSVGPALSSFIDEGAIVACERYVIGENTIRKSRSATNTTMSVIGIVEETCRVNHARLHMQSSSDAKTFGNVRTLQKLGWYIRGYRHATDAARHLLLLVARTDVEVFTKLVNDNGV